MTKKVFDENDYKDYELRYIKGEKTSFKELVMIFNRPASFITTLFGAIFILFIVWFMREIPYTDNIVNNNAVIVFTSGLCILAVISCFLLMVGIIMNVKHQIDLSHSISDYNTQLILDKLDEKKEN